jgi:hypothetical protein
MGADVAGGPRFLESLAVSAGAHENEFRNLVRLAATILSPERLKLLLLALDGRAAKNGRK